MLVKVIIILGLLTGPALSSELKDDKQVSLESKSDINKVTETFVDKSNIEKKKEESLLKVEDSKLQKQDEDQKFESGVSLQQTDAVEETAKVQKLQTATQVTQDSSKLSNKAEPIKQTDQQKQDEKYDQLEEQEGQQAQEPQVIESEQKEIKEQKKIISKGATKIGKEVQAQESVKEIKEVKGDVLTEQQKQVQPAPKRTLKEKLFGHHSSRYYEYNPQFSQQQPNYQQYQYQSQYAQPQYGFSSPFFQPYAQDQYSSLSSNQPKEAVKGSVLTSQYSSTRQYPAGYQSTSYYPSDYYQRPSYFSRFFNFFRPQYAESNPNFSSPNLQQQQLPKY